jgi:hypothetical protein
MIITSQVGDQAIPSGAKMTMNTEGLAVPWTGSLKYGILGVAAEDMPARSHIAINMEDTFPAWRRQI